MAVTWKKIAYYSELLSVEEQEVIGRLTGGNVDGITIGIADNNMVQIDGDPNDDEFARFTANGLEGLDKTETLDALNVEDGADKTDETNVKAALNGATITNATKKHLEILISHVEYSSRGSYSRCGARRPVLFFAIIISSQKRFF